MEYEPEDGKSSNVEGFDGYVSWSPKEVFERAYRRTNGMSFGLAIEAMKRGHRVCRTGWNGKGMWIGLVEDDQWNTGSTYSWEAENVPRYLPWIGMKTADNCFVPWLASQTDMLADDWMIVA